MSRSSLKFIGLLVLLATTAGPASTLGQTDGFRTKEITKLSPKASVVLEKNCPVIVPPYLARRKQCRMRGHGYLPAQAASSPAAGPLLRPQPTSSAPQPS